MRHSRKWSERSRSRGPGGTRATGPRELRPPLELQMCAPASSSHPQVSVPKINTIHPFICAPRRLSIWGMTTKNRGWPRINTNDVIWHPGAPGRVSAFQSVQICARRANFSGACPVEYPRFAYPLQPTRIISVSSVPVWFRPLAQVQPAGPERKQNEQQRHRAHRDRWRTRSRNVHDRGIPAQCPMPSLYFGVPITS